MTRGGFTWISEGCISISRTTPLFAIIDSKPKATKDNGETNNPNKTLFSRAFPLRSLSNTAKLTDKTRARKTPVAFRLPWRI